jgi:hypothetical protein
MNQNLPSQPRNVTISEEWAFVLLVKRKIRAKDHSFIIVVVILIGSANAHIVKICAS